jgi:hypothetical protein
MPTFIQYTKEILYHFNCEECKKWWSVSDFTLSGDPKQKMSCPHCNRISIIEPLENKNKD